jgi:hypothetical protein
MPTKAEQIRDAILADVTDRRGWSQEWDQFDADVKEEIRATWLSKIQEVLDRPD